MCLDAAFMLVQIYTNVFFDGLFVSTSMLVEDFPYVSTETTIIGLLSFSKRSQLTLRSLWMDARHSWSWLLLFVSRQHRRLSFHGWCVPMYGLGFMALA